MNSTMKSKNASLYITLATVPFIGYGLYYYFYIYKKKRITLFQDPTAKYTVFLKSIKEVTHDTKKFIFALPTLEHSLGLPTGQHMYIHADINGNKVVKPYTPISLEDAKGFFELVIKVYHKNVNPKFPDGGRMTQHLDSLKIGDPIEIRGPSGRLSYLGDGKFAIKPDKNSPPEILNAKHIGMIAGGTGITPMFQLIQAVLRNPDTESKDIKFYLLFANQSENDILLREEIEGLAKQYPDRLTYWYTVDQAPDGWKYSQGYVNSKMIADHLPPPLSDAIILSCGPPPMVKLAVMPSLEALGYDPKRIFAY